MPADSIRKAVVLARGLGTRMRRSDTAAQLSPAQVAIAETGMKGMISVGRPFLDYVLSGLADAGFPEVCLVIGPEHGAIREYYGGQVLRRVHLHYAVQRDARGTADAVASAEGFVGNDEFIVLNSDNYYPAEALRKLRELASAGTVLFHRESLAENSNIPRDRIRQFAYANVDEQGLLVDLVEKPSEHCDRDNVLVSMNCWRFSPTISKFCRSIPLSPRGEYELPSAVLAAIRSGMSFKIATSDCGVLDLSVRSDIAAVAEYLKGVEVSL